MINGSTSAKPRPAGRRFFWLAALFLLFAGTAVALDPTRTLHQYRATHWTRQNGLPVNSVNAIAQTHDGYLWLGTQQGLIRFDGIEFTPFSVPRTPSFVSQNISTLSASANGGLWFGLREGAAGFFDGTVFSPLPARWVEPNMMVAKVTEVSDGSVWVAWNFGYARWRPQNQSIAEIERTVGTIPFHALHEDRRGRIWLSAVDQTAVYYFENGTRHTFPDPELKGKNVFSIVDDRDGNVWMGTSGGLRVYGPDFKLRRTAPFDSHAQVNAVLIDRHETVWMATEGEGVWRYQGGVFEAYTAASGLISDYVNALYEDAEGNLWIATRGGISKLSDVKFPLYTTREGLAGEPLGVANAGSGAVWVATISGLSRIEGSKITSLGPQNGLPNQYIKRPFQASNGDVYVIDGDRGLSILSNGKVVARHLRSEWPVAITEDEEGVIVSFAGEICRVTRETVTPFTYPDRDPPPIVWAQMLAPARDGSLWVGSHRGVWHLRNGTYDNWSTHNGLTSSVANWVVEDEDGTVWAGLASGVARFRDGRVVCMGSNEGLFDNFIYAIVPDAFGWFWMDSSAGIFRVRRQVLNDFADGKIKSITCEPFNGPEAVKSNDKRAQEASTAVTADGRIWFPTAGGVVAVDPARIGTNPVPPPVYIQTTKIDGRVVAGRNLTAPSAGRGDLEFHYTALSFAAPTKVRFRYFLEGYDHQWVEAGERRSAFYTNLKPGTYVFSVQASNADGVWNTAGDRVELTLPPHFYQTPWFRALLAFAVISALAGIYAWRVSALRRRQRTLQEMNTLLDAKVQTRTTELAQANQLLREEITERKRFEQEAEKMNQQLILASREAGMAEVATSVLHNVGNVLNSVNVSVSVISAHLRDAKFDALGRIGRLLTENARNPDFLSTDPKGQKIPAYIERLSDHLGEQHAAISRELLSLRKNIEHIKDIVQMQQGYSRLQAPTEMMRVEEVVDDALRLSGASLAHRNLRIVRDVEPGLAVLVDKPKVLQVLVNLLRNSIQACIEGGVPDGPITVRVRAIDTRVRLDVIDPGIGIASENIGRLFNQGFTTKKDGHGYGLHSSALAARAMGGTLSAVSAGIGKGATFTLELPLETAPAVESAPVAR